MTDIIESKIDLTLTKHAQTRMQQRGISKSDVDNIAMCGTAINDHEILFTNKDAEHERSHIQNRLKQLRRSGNERHCAQEVCDLKHWRINIDRLINLKIVIYGDIVITCYWCTKSELKRISRIMN